MAKRDSFLFTIVAMLVLLLLSYSPNNTNNNHCYRHRHLLLPGSDCILSADYNQHIPDSHADHLDSDVTNMILHFFPEIDVDPTDWMEFHDKDHDGYVSFSESEPPSRLQDSYDNGDWWWKEEHFNASDADGDGFLNLTEFNDFLHPADSNNPKLQQWLCKTERERYGQRWEGQF